MVSKIGLWVTVCSSLRWLCVAASLWMWNRSRVFRCGLFLWNCKMLITSWMRPKECTWLFKCSANLDVWELCLKARIALICTPWLHTWYLLGDRYWIFKRIYISLIWRSTQLGPRSPRVEVSRSHTITHKHPVGLLWKSGQSVAENATYKTQNKHKRITSMSSAEFEPAIPTKPLHTYALDRRDTRIGFNNIMCTL